MTEKPHSLVSTIPDLLCSKSGNVLARILTALNKNTKFSSLTVHNSKML